jgi:two-component system, sensor histidine kinase and response regulator
MAEMPTPILDLRYLIEVCDGDATFIRDIIADYLSEMPKYLAELDAAVTGEGAGGMVRPAHTIKGASANVGAVRVRDTADRLESLAKRGTIEGSNMLIRLLHNEIDRVKDLVARQGVEGLMRAT